MKVIVTASAVWLGTLSLAGSLWAATVPSEGAGGTYQVVLDRNPFGLKPPPPPPKLDESKQEAPPLNVKLSGISSLSGYRKAYLVTTEQGKKDIDYVTLSEGEALGSLEVLEIDERAGTVKIRNGTVTKILDMKSDAPKDAPAPPQPGPGAPGAPANVQIYQAPQNNAGQPQNFGGQPSAQPMTAPGNSGAGGTAPGGTSPSGASPLKNIPSRTLRLPPGGKTSSYSVGPSGQIPDTSLSPEVRTLSFLASDKDGFPPVPQLPNKD